MAAVDLVVKVGGGLLKSPAELDRVLGAITAASQNRRLLVVPGGGPFADAVRAVDRELHLSADAAHWMAILAMDQCAHVLAERLKGSAVIEDPRAVGMVLKAGHIPVLAPSRWMRAADPLPHSWDVTSDSIAAWVAGEVAAPNLILIKPAGASGAEMLDAYFSRALPADVVWKSVTADQVDEALIHFSTD